jgi:glycosyltransferase involved in cell wall biosynthesis
LVANGHDIEVVTASYPGARRRVDDGVLYRQIGLGIEYFTSILSYHALLPPVVLATRRGARRPDLLVEEFAPPWSSFGVTRLSTAPALGNVQGYFASEKAREYRVPQGALTRIQRLGARSHRHLVAVSSDLATRLALDAPDAVISVIPVGIDPDVIRSALAPTPEPVPRQILFLGRLEIAQKGLDLLLQACAGLLEHEDARLVIAGDGRDADHVRALASSPSLRDRVTFIGRISGREKWRLLASSQFSVVPSRYETFGLSALESLACGTPVVGFAIECLRDTVPPETGILVEPFEVRALTEAMRSMLLDPAVCAQMGERGRRYAAAYTWDSIAAAQEQAYLSAAGGVAGA